MGNGLEGAQEDRCGPMRANTATHVSQERVTQTPLGLPGKFDEGPGSQTAIGTVVREYSEVPPSIPGPQIARERHRTLRPPDGSLGGVVPAMRPCWSQSSELLVAAKTDILVYPEFSQGH